jgi:hypothetical protein
MPDALEFRRRFNQADTLQEQLDLIDGVAICIKQSDILAREAEQVEALGRLHHPEERLGMKTIGRNRQLTWHVRKSVGSEDALGAKDGKPIEGMVPEPIILAERAKRLQ